MQEKPRAVSPPWTSERAFADAGYSTRPFPAGPGSSSARFFPVALEGVKTGSSPPACSHPPAPQPCALRLHPANHTVFPFATLGGAAADLQGGPSACTHRGDAQRWSANLLPHGKEDCSSFR